MSCKVIYTGKNLDEVVNFLKTAWGCETNVVFKKGTKVVVRPSCEDRFEKGLWQVYLQKGTKIVLVPGGVKTID